MDNQVTITTANNYITSRLNAVSHGLLSRHVVLPWEDKAEYEELVRQLIHEHQPTNLTEGHIVTELAGIIWRKKRLREAEASLYRNEIAQCVNDDGFGPPKCVQAVAATTDASVNVLSDELDKLSMSQRSSEHKHTQVLRQQIFGQAYLSSGLDTLHRYETHLDRKFERCLAVLMKLREPHQQGL